MVSFSLLLTGLIFGIIANIVMYVHLKREKNENIDSNVDKGATIINYSAGWRSRDARLARLDTNLDSDSVKFVYMRGRMPTILELHESTSTQDSEDHSTSHAATGDSNTLHNTGFSGDFAGDGDHAGENSGVNSGGGDC